MINVSCPHLSLQEVFLCISRLICSSSKNSSNNAIVINNNNKSNNKAQRSRSQRIKCFTFKLRFTGPIFVATGVKLATQTDDRLWHFLLLFFHFFDLICNISQYWFIVINVDSTWALSVFMFLFLFRFTSALKGISRVKGMASYDSPVILGEVSCCLTSLDFSFCISNWRSFFFFLIPFNHSFRFHSLSFGFRMPIIRLWWLILMLLAQPTQPKNTGCIGLWRIFR